jgi:hypothetical protein
MIQPDPIHLQYHCAKDPNIFLTKKKNITLISQSAPTENL